MPLLYFTSHFLKLKGKSSTCINCGHSIVSPPLCPHSGFFFFFFRRERKRKDELWQLVVLFLADLRFFSCVSNKGKEYRKCCRMVQQQRPYFEGIQYTIVSSFYLLLINSHSHKYNPILLSFGNPMPMPPKSKSILQEDHKTTTSSSSLLPLKETFFTLIFLLSHHTQFTAC